MSTSAFSFRPIFKKSLLGVLLAANLNVPVFAQISFEDGEGKRADSRKIRREAAKYKAEAVKESHLNMEMYSYKRGQPGNRPVSEELAYDEIYYGPNPVKKERKFFKKKR